MNLAELRSRIQNWEDVHTEFKLQAVHPDDLAAAIVAFANSDGGQLIVGVSNERRVVGVTDLDKLRQYVENVALNNCVPPISISLERHSRSGNGARGNHPQRRPTPLQD